MKQSINHILIILITYFSMLSNMPLNLQYLKRNVINIMKYAWIEGSINYRLIK
ncbi:hypothetical protein GLOIN_2v1618894 [Rhizophagus irregularis DAOM 181602=DAOM 197198]|uniref:Uncharacterized protein n=1 Tax=Rhizophagus irregularis (strain DAOM 181602 / DAOM 197198 / MUCL 43194) TaxID=747089 RepID=A0A2P4PXT1_RHIID|nr:hypothetical protein GLOIN_2v1618894 [Rhizophagus irregularis DAOM 181602=DAOM 197198]POG70201.1 hypothetical protein GLOIN_2v1618894 [Rhizophagus irregularis DAOM 181602=DAOM 197198]|eukprot:XP_025177067.1 hypothetical protein GLOIN_2v1618894 [Rhizophagus irregularis DAOM 181602=DAOM 197198]